MSSEQNELPSEVQPVVDPVNAVEESEEVYRVWACDNQVYGPISLSILIEWVQEARVLRDTWIYVESRGMWCQAETISEIQVAISPSDDTIFLSRQSLDPNSIDPCELRLFPALAGLSNHDLAHLIRLSELVMANPGDVIIRRNDPGDAIHFVLSGSVRAQITVGYEAKVLGKIPSGQFFGEMSMFTQTPRTADIIADEEARLLRFSAEAFRTLMSENPAAAAPMLYAISTTMAQRLLDMNNRYQGEIAQGFLWR